MEEFGIKKYNIKRYKVSSSMFNSIGYDKIEKILHVEFKNKDIWEYKEVPENVYEELKNNESIGKYYLANIKNNYKANKI